MSCFDGITVFDIGIPICLDCQFPPKSIDCALLPDIQISRFRETVDGINQATPGAAGMIVPLFEIRALYLGTLEPAHDFMMK